MGGEQHVVSQLLLITPHLQIAQIVVKGIFYLRFYLRIVAQKNQNQFLAC